MMQRPGPQLSVVIPAYDEAKRISETLRAIDAHAAASGWNAELIVVDDGSSDGTADVVRRLGSELATPLRILRYASNRGKGFALKVGFAASVGEKVLFTDADLSTPIAWADVLLAELEHADVVIASRKTAGSQLLVRQPWLRESMGRVFTAISHRLIAPVSDVTCGFKAFRGEVGRDLFSRCRIEGWSFDAELLFVARLRRVSMHEVPVEWRDAEGSKVRILRDALGALAGLARIRWNGARGVYATSCAPVAQLEELSVDVDAQAARSEATR